MRASGRAVLTVSLASFAAASVTLCGSPRAAIPGTSLTILYPAGFDERITGPIWADAARFLVFLPLVEDDGQGEREGRLAERWSHSPDRREWTFHLRQGVRWHDGVPVTAHDVAFSLDLYRTSGMPWDAPDAYRVRVPDDSTVIVSYAKPDRDPLHTWKVFWPKHLLEGLDPAQIVEWDFWVRPVGNGPYRYVRHVGATMLELEANPDFYAGKPRIERLVLKFGGSTAAVELLSGNVDAVRYFNQADLPRIAHDARFRSYHSIEPIGLQTIYWSHRSPLFSSALVRQALTLAIDRRQLLGVLNLPQDIRIADALFTVRQYFRDTLPAPLPYDPDSAARLLDAAGWRDSDGDGVRDRAGREFRFLALAPSNPILAVTRGTLYVQDQLRRVGVHLELQTLEVSVLGPRIRAGEFEAAFYPFHNQIGSGPSQWFGERSPLGYRNREMVAGLEAVAASSDLDEIEEIYRSLSPIFRADLPVTFLFPQVSTFVAHRRVQGLRSGMADDPIIRMPRLWLDDAR